MAEFLNALISRIFEVFCERFFARNNCYVVESFFAFFGRLVLILSQSDHFAKAVCSLCIPYRPCKIADFQNCLISRLFGVFFEGLL